MFTIWSFGDELHRVSNGRKKSLKCSRCNKQATWHECLVDNKLQLYFVIDLFKNTRRVMQCGECLGVCDFYEIFPEEKAQQAKDEALKRKQEAEEEIRKREQAEAERIRCEQEENKRREEKRLQQNAAVDDELAKLKRQLGKD